MYTTIRVQNTYVASFFRLDIMIILEALFNLCSKIIKPSKNMEQSKGSCETIGRSEAKDDITDFEKSVQKYIETNGFFYKRGGMYGLDIHILNSDFMTCLSFKNVLNCMSKITSQIIGINKY